MLYHVHDPSTTRNIGKRPNDVCAAVETCRYVINTLFIRAFVGLIV